MKISITKYFLLIVVMVFLSPLPANTNTGLQPESNATVYHIPLQIHLGESERPVPEWLPILAEINTIWFSQAGICFTIHTVPHDQKTEDSLDLWFEPLIPGWNGYFTDQNDMHVRDNPNLRPAANPANSSAARTAAHELGHALGLDHRQDSDENLMRSKTYGWQLNKDEISQARETAIELATAISNEKSCPAPRLHATP